MLKIREFSKLCKCSVYTLRYYDQIGILKPSIIDTKSGYRFYDEKQLNDYIEIKDFQSIGFSILEIQSFNSKTNNEILQMIDEKQSWSYQYILKRNILEDMKNEKRNKVHNFNMYDCYNRWM